MQCSQGLDALTSQQSLLYPLSAIFRYKAFESTQNRYRMLIYSLFFFLGLAISLVTATTPSTLFRGDTRLPRDIKAAGGFKARGFKASGFNEPDRPDILFEHINKAVKPPFSDPFVSTSKSKAAAQDVAGSKAFMFTLDSSKIPSKIHDCEAAYIGRKPKNPNPTEREIKLAQKYPFPKEQEFSVENFIPLSAIVKVERRVNGRYEEISMDFAGNESVQKPAGESAKKPTTKPAGEPATKPADKPAGEPAKKPTTKPAGESAKKPAGKPAGKPSKASQFKPAGKHRRNSTWF